MVVVKCVPLLVQMLASPSMYARRVMVEICVKDVIFMLSAEESFAEHVPQLPGATPEPARPAWQPRSTCGPGTTRSPATLAGTSKIH